jgi:Transposase
VPVVSSPRNVLKKLVVDAVTLSHSLSHSVSHMTYDPPAAWPIIPPGREGHRRKFSEADKHQILEEVARPGANLSAVARRYGIAARVLFRWKQELTATPVFIAVQITDAQAPADVPRSDEEHAP